jgi:hypothetical protein
MVCKPVNLIKVKLKNVYDTMFWVCVTVRQTSVFDAKSLFYRISQLTPLTSENIFHPERFDQMIHIEQQEESLPHIVSILLEESLSIKSAARKDSKFNCAKQ